MDSTLIAGVVGAVATIAAALIGLRQKNRADRAKSRLQSLTSNGFRQSMLTSFEYGIKVVSPEEYSSQGMNFQVSGTYEELPEGQLLWTATFDVVEMNVDGSKKRVKRYWPQAPAKTQEKRWYSRINHLGGNIGEIREYVILVVGKEGQALFKYYTEAGDINHNWPPITQLISDIAECATSKITLS